MEATELRINNCVKCKVSNDAGIYFVTGIDGWARIFKSKAEGERYKKYFGGEDFKGKPIEWRDERLIRLAGGARQNEQYPESKIGGIKLDEQWLEQFGFKKAAVGGMFYIENFGIESETWYCYLRKKKENETTFTGLPNPIQFVHQLQNLYFYMTGIELQVK